MEIKVLNAQGYFDEENITGIKDTAIWEYAVRERIISDNDLSKWLPCRQDADGEIQEISFLGGLLHGYRRVKQAA